MKIKKKDVKAFITTTLDEAEKKKLLRLTKKKRKSGAKSGFAGVPIGIKDNLCTNGVKTTCASKMLENFVASYDATVVEKAKRARHNQFRKAKYGRICDGKFNREFCNANNT